MFTLKEDDWSLCSLIALGKVWFWTISVWICIISSCKFITGSYWRSALMICFLIIVSCPKCRVSIKWRFESKAHTAGTSSVSENKWQQFWTLIQQNSKTLDIFIVQFELVLNLIFRLFPWERSAFLGHICLFISHCWSNAGNEKAMQHILKYRSAKNCNNNAVRLHLSFCWPQTAIMISPLAESIHLLTLTGWHACNSWHMVAVHHFILSS